MASFYLMGNSSRTQMFGCVIKTKNKTIVIDGGTVRDSAQMVKFLREHSDLHVDAWFFTHPHHDHIGCFVGIRNGEEKITVDRVYHHFPALREEKYAALARTEQEAALWNDVATWDREFDVRTVEVGDAFSFDEVTVRVLRVWNPAIDQNVINNSSTVYRIEGEQASILILGDLGVEGGEDLLARCPIELLHTDYTQMAHHGQKGVNREFYEQIKPRRCLWASPDWLWNNDRGNGFDSDQFLTVRTREWMASLGVTEHYVEKDGTQKFEF